MRAWGHRPGVIAVLAKAEQMVSVSGGWCYMLDDENMIMSAESLTTL